MAAKNKNQQQIDLDNKIQQPAANPDQKNRNFNNQQNKKSNGK